MAEESKHPPTTEEQAPPEMPGKAPEMEQAEIPDVGGGPAPSAKVIDLSAVRSTPEKDAPTDIPKEPEAQPVSVTEYSKQEWKKPMPEPEKTKPKRGRPAKSEKAAPTEPGAKKEAQAEKPRRGRPSKAEKAAPEQTKPPKAGKTHAAPEEKAEPAATSLASSLKRFRLAMESSQMTMPSRTRRSWASRVILPSVTRQPATVPTLEIL